MVLSLRDEGEVVPTVGDLERSLEESMKNLAELNKLSQQAWANLLVALQAMEEDEDSESEEPIPTESATVGMSYKEALLQVPHIVELVAEEEQLHVLNLKPTVLGRMMENSCKQELKGEIAQMVAKSETISSESVKYGDEVVVAVVTEEQSIDPIEVKFPSLILKQKVDNVHLAKLTREENVELEYMETYEKRYHKQKKNVRKRNRKCVESRKLTVEDGLGNGSSRTMRDVCVKEYSKKKKTKKHAKATTERRVGVASEPHGWLEAKDPTCGASYYYNKSTGNSQWGRPLESSCSISTQSLITFLEDEGEARDGTTGHR